MPENPSAQPSSTFTVVLLAAVDALPREAVLGGALLELPDAVTLSYEHRWSADPETDGRLSVTRRVSDRTGRIWTDDVTGAFDCACCCVEDDLVGVLRLLRDQGRWSQVLVSLPLGAPVGQVANALMGAIADESLDGAGLGAVAAAVDHRRLEDTIFGDDLLAERWASLSTIDRRSVGEAAVEQIEYADLVLGVDRSATDPGTTTALLRQLAPGRVLTDWVELTAADLVGVRHDPNAVARRGDPLDAPDGLVDQDDGPVWTLRLGDSRPLHPERLLARLEELAIGRFRGRGVFWLPTRPKTACVWDGVGGQLSVGALPGWGDRSPMTRLVITGTDPAERNRVREAFADVVVRPSEWPVGGSAWTGREDGFEPWLGDRQLTR